MCLTCWSVISSVCLFFLQTLKQQLDLSCKSDFLSAKSILLHGQIFTHNLVFIVLANVTFCSFTFRVGENGIMEQDDLNEDSFFPGGNVWTYSSKLIVFKQSRCFNLSSLCAGDISVSAVSPPPRKPAMGPRFMPIIGSLNHSTPRLSSQLLLSEVSKSSYRLLLCK